MKWCFGMLIRALAVSALGIVAIAIALGRSTGYTPPVNHAAAVRFHGVNMRCTPDGEGQPCFIDRQSGEILRLEVPAGEVLDYVSCSPWRDERGQFQAVGRWMNRAGKQYAFLPQDFGLARVSLPEGKILERVCLEQVPIGEPCWIPGLAPRILFPSGDGQIYRYDFAEPGQSPGGAKKQSQLQRVEWAIAPPGTGMVYVRDLIWPAEAALGGRLIAAVCYLEHENRHERPKMKGPELWWLRLDRDQTVVEAAGRLTVADTEDALGDEDEDVEERLANVAATADGELALAYLSRSSLEQHWELRVAPIAIEPVTGVPTVLRSSSREVGKGFVCSAPTFSADGRWLYGVRGRESGGAPLTLRRFSAATTLMAQSEVIPAWPVRPRVDPSPLFGWADLMPIPPSRVVEGGRSRHAGR
jgi:hypothetical protein